jgi:hypothetical protein
MPSPGLHLLSQPQRLDATACATLRRVLAPDALARRGLHVGHGPTGTGCEVPVDHHPILAQLAEGLARWVGLPLGPDATFRLRDCRRGQGHPPHHDDYPSAGGWLVASAAIYLDACEGGETTFPVAERVIEPAPGRAVAWLNLDADGQVVPAAEHGMNPVRRGRRRALFLFFYASAAQVAQAAALRAAPPAAGPDAAEADLPLVAALHPVRTERWAVPRTLHLVVAQGLPDTTRDSLHAAAVRRRIAVAEYDPATTGDAVPPAEPGDLLYSPSTSNAARRLERALWRPGVGCFDAGPDGPYAELHDPWALMSLRGVPLPRSAHLTDADPDRVARLVLWLGGLPLVVKVSGGEGGVGVMRADTAEGLQSLLEFLLSQGHRPQVQTFIADAMHWRAVVVGDRVVAAYKNPIKTNDFRSWPSNNPADYGTEAPPAVAAAALSATAALRLEFAGVDVLEHPSGRVFVLEANCPCYHPQAEHFGVDVAGPMVDHLVALAERARGG